MKNNKGNIIILNGVSSSGKTTMSKAIQRHMKEHYFWVANDTFCEMCSTTHWKEDWILRINEAQLAMIHTVKAFSDLGFNVVLDQVFQDNESQGTILQECVKVLHDYPVLFVRTDCELEYLKSREIERGNRRIGQAESQLNTVHNHGVYDVEINTSNCDVDRNVEKIQMALMNPKDNRAFSILYDKVITTGSVY